MGISTPIQLGLADFICSGQYQSHLNRLHTFLTFNIQKYIEFLSSHLPQNSLVSAPQGGLVLWIQVAGLDSKTLGAEAKQQGIDIRIGPDFTTLDLYQDYLRINTGWPMDERIKNELAMLCKLICQQTTAEC